MYEILKNYLHHDVDVDKVSVCTKIRACKYWLFFNPKDKEYIKSLLEGIRTVYGL